MSKRGARTAVIKKTIKNNEMVDMFNQMVGISAPDVQIVIPKYKNIIEKAQEIISILQNFVTHPVVAAYGETCPKSIKEFHAFVAAADKEIAALKLEPNDRVLSARQIQELNSNKEKLAEYLQTMSMPYKVDQLKENYNTLKNCNSVKEIIMIARNIKNAVMEEKGRVRGLRPRPPRPQAAAPTAHKEEQSAPNPAKPAEIPPPGPAAPTATAATPDPVITPPSAFHDLENRAALSKNFILYCEGDYLQLFNFTSFDFKQLFISDFISEPKFEDYVLLSLHLIYKRAIAIVEAVTSPDIDVDRFSEILIDQIQEVKKLVPRCDKAFRKIEQSVGMLKQNFGDYYKGFVTSQSGNPGAFIESFISDVAHRSDVDRETFRQFERIIKFYQQKMTSNKVSDPKVLNMMNLVKSNLSILDAKISQRAGEDSGDRRDQV
jgi:hypothetical protein